MQSEFSIGRIADEAGVYVETIRYYQRCGLLSEPAKPLNGHRRYPAAMVKRVRFIKRAQILGFTLEELSDLLDLEEVHACAETRELATRKLQLIESKLADLKAMLRALVRSSMRWQPTEGSRRRSLRMLVLGGPPWLVIVHAFAAVVGFTLLLVT